MNPKILLAAAAGAAITVTVYEGSAILNGPGEVVALAAGETHSSPGSGTPGSGARAPAGNQPRITIDSPGQPALAPEIQQELDKLRLTNQFLEGQLSANGIRPNDWPETLPAPLEPEAFTANIKAALKDFPELKLMDIDCSEYPCVAVIEDMNEEPDTVNMEPMRASLHEGLDVGIDSRVTGGIFQTQDGDRYIEVWALMAPDADEGTVARAEMRSHEILMAAGEEE